MSKLGALLKVSALAGALALSVGANAATFQVPINYTVEVVDGQTSDFGYNRFDRSLTLSQGRHQIVLLFEGTFGNARDSRLYQAANPIVVEIADMPADGNYTFTYEMPRDNREAEIYSRSQKINLINATTKAPLSEAEASYFLLTSDSGFAILRDYREDLASVGRLYAPAKVFEEMRSNETRQGMTANNVPTVQARVAGYRGNYQTPAVVAPAATGVSATVATAAAQNSANKSEEVKSVQSISSSAAATYNQLVQTYEAADDATKLKFVKYIMSH